jgi:hypothetical protein
MPAAIETRPRRPDFPDVTRYQGARPRGAPFGGFSRPVHRATRASRRARTTSTSTIAAAIETRPRRPDSPDVTRYHGARPRGAPFGGFSRPVHRATRASRRARNRQRPGSTQVRSSLTSRQPFGASMAVLDGPCDRGNLRPTLRAVDGVPGSHGPTEEKVSALGLRFPYRSTGCSVQSIFSFLAGRGGPRLGCPARPPRPQPRFVPPRSSRPLQTSGPGDLPQPQPRFVASPDRTGRFRPAARGTCPNRSRAASRRPIKSAAAGPRSGNESRKRSAVRALSSNFLARESAARHEGTVWLMSRAKRAKI